MPELAFAAAAAAAVGLALGLELRLFAPGRIPGRREALVWSVGWVGFAVAIAAGIALVGGPTGEWTTVYLIERSLSLDNVFLFSLLLTYFVVPPELRGRVILVGIAGALVLRGIAIAGGVALIDRIDAVVYVFGALLLFVAYRTFRGTARDLRPRGEWPLRAGPPPRPDDRRLPGQATFRPRGREPVRHPTPARRGRDRRRGHCVRRRLDPRGIRRHATTRS